MDFESLIRFKTLQEVYTRRNGALVDHFLKDPAVSEQLGLKKLQFDVSQQLFDGVEAICGILDMSKREFLEAAVQQAVANAHQIIAESSLVGDEEQH